MPLSLRKAWQALTDSTRLRIIALLQREELTVAELQEILNVGQSGISMHLSILKTSGLAEARKEGKFSYYRIPEIHEASGTKLIDAALNSVSELPESENDRAALKLVIQKRRAVAQNYFNQVAGRLSKAPCPGRGWSAVGPLLAHLIPRCTIADLGAGEGWLSQLMAQHAEKVIAIDNSPKMVEFGRKEAKRRKLTNLEYRLGDLAHPPIDPNSIDYVIMSQALHHAVNPAHSIQAAARLLKPHGRLIILDLNAHSFDRARELLGDTWLGFRETELRKWLQEAGLINLRFQLLETENGPFKVQPALICGETSGK
ncbi:MAG: metalloregulator ArsR/SmtB family transcription factor [Verrucomicrobiota bacterium]